MSEDKGKDAISHTVWCRWCKHCDDDAFCRAFCNDWYQGRPKAYCDKREKGCECCNKQCKAINYCKKED